MNHLQENTWRILHIDDDHEDHLLVREMLTFAQGRAVIVDWASTFEEGRQKLSGEVYQAVLVDYELGPDNGIELIREFVEKDYKAPLILLTGSGSYEVDVAAMRAGATLYLTKAEINPPLLERSIRYAIERKQVERKYKESEARLRENSAALLERDRKLSVALEAAQLGTWTYTFADHRIELDERAQRMYRVEQARVHMDVILQNHLHPQDVEPLRTALRRAASPGGDGKVQIEHRVALPEGGYFWLNAWGLVEFEGQGDDRRAVRLTGASRDITHEKQAKENLHDNERRYRELAEALNVERGTLAATIENMPVGVCIADAHGGMLSMNHAGLKLHGFDSEAEMFSHLDKYVEEFELAYPDGRLMPFEDWPASRALRGEFVHDYEVRLRNQMKGTEHILSYSAAPVKNSDGETVLIVYVIQDMTEHMRADAVLRENSAALRESEQKYRELAEAYQAERSKLAAVIENLPVGVWIADASGALVSKNLYADRIWAGDAPLLEDVAAYPVYSAWWPDSGRAVLPEEYPVAKALRTGQPIEPVEMRIRRFDNTTGYILVSAVPIKDAKGRRVGAVGVNMDITGRKEAELALRESEARFRQLADAMPQLVWTAEPGGSVDYYNQRYQMYSGIGPELENSWEWAPVLHPDDVQPTLAAWEEAVRTGSTYQIEHRVRMADGSYRWHLSRGIPAFDDQGRLVKWFGTATDIDDVKVAQNLLRYREQRMRSLFEANIIGIVSRDPAGTILEANDAFLHLTGYSREEMAGKNLTIRDITPPEYSAIDRQCTEEVLARGFFKPYEKEYLTRDGRRIPVLIGYTLLQNEQTELIGFVLDLSELKRAQAGLAEYAEKLKNSNEELERFAFVASHDLQEPLRKISMFGSGLRKQLEDQLTPEAEDYLGRMESAAERMRAMINGLLDLSRVSTQEGQFEPVNLTKVAEEVASDLEARIHATGGTVVIEQLPTVNGDVMQLRRLLQNLIGNGLKFHRPGVPPRVRVLGGLVRGNEVPLANIVVEDNGVGFDEATAGQIFQPFVRLHGRSAYEGSGMGLAICRKIVERHGGSIFANSRPGEGSRFTVILPLRL